MEYYSDHKDISICIDDISLNNSNKVKENTYDNNNSNIITNIISENDIGLITNFLVGLVNANNICYMNASIQILIHIDILI